jgi:hypothetical protein
MSSVPTIQFVPQNHSKATITIRLHTEHYQWNQGAYIRFVDTLKSSVIADRMMRCVNLVPMHVDTLH